MRRLFILIYAPFLLCHCPICLIYRLASSVIKVPFVSGRKLSCFLSPGHSGRGKTWYEISNQYHSCSLLHAIESSLPTLLLSKSRKISREREKGKPVLWIKRDPPIWAGTHFLPPKTRGWPLERGKNPRHMEMLTTWYETFSLKAVTTYAYTWRAWFM